MCAFSLFKKTLPGTVITVEDLSGAIGSAIDQAFKNYMPQPDKMATAVKTAVGEAGKDLGDQLQAGAKEFGTQVAAFKSAAEKLESALKTHVEKMSAAVTEASKGAGDALSEKLKAGAKAFEASMGSLDTSAGKIDSALKGHTAELQKTLTENSKKMEAAAVSMKDGLQPVLTSHAESLKKANQTIADKLNEIMGLQKQIDSVLQLQKTVEGTIKNIAASNDFTSTLSALQKRLTESDELVKSATKPRTIRFVETPAE
ncbi:MAG: hypothetical protein AB7T27_08355 [Kiritimatiellia bacterium]